MPERGWKLRRAAGAKGQLPLSFGAVKRQSPRDADIGSVVAPSTPNAPSCTAGSSKLEHSGPHRSLGLLGSGENVEKLLLLKDPTASAGTHVLDHSQAQAPPDSLTCQSRSRSRTPPSFSRSCTPPRRRKLVRHETGEKIERPLKLALPGPGNSFKEQAALRSAVSVPCPEATSGLSPLEAAMDGSRRSRSRTPPYLRHGNVGSRPAPIPALQYSDDCTEEPPATQPRRSQATSAISTPPSLTSLTVGLTHRRLGELLCNAALPLTDSEIISCLQSPVTPARGVSGIPVRAADRTYREVVSGWRTRGSMLLRQSSQQGRRK
eukprot:gnl/TRDRNA2_/TRDRNA2_84912_c0_seq1.p1 gnl/TRDRNA2_/TRDRNA2_84912_c0~~gnl/TRDRNA2_/TRDRNA2_84912_c0_seq1.p1  ORF type:complete len:321 (+),score=7.89 gnl/TRDRNA2_/TRDRNA2_84912_c0_seq1:3-965(+)